jgi:hypothetical protein
MSRIEANTVWPACARASEVNLPNPDDAPVINTVILLIIDIP